MKATKGVAVALLVLGAAACNRRDNAGQTNTTSGDYDRQRDMSGAAPAAPVTTPQDQAPSGDQTSAGSNIDRNVDRGDNVDRGSMQGGALQGGNADYARKDGGSRSSAVGSGNDLTDHPSTDTSGGVQQGSGSDRAGSTSVTSGDVNQDRNKDQNNANANEGASKGKNQSTTLGNGKSGEYTGGKGTYGGKATWGTGTTTKDNPQPKP